MVCKAERKVESDYSMVEIGWRCRTSGLVGHVSMVFRFSEWRKTPRGREAFLWLVSLVFGVAKG